MKSIFTITVITKENYGEGDPTLFTENGDMVGRTLAYRKNDIDSDNVFYSFDIETSEEMYNKLKSGEIKLYHLKEYSVYKSNLTHYRD